MVVTDQESPPPARTRMSTGDKVRFVLRGIGQTLITAGLVVLLFVVYEVWITNIFADRNNSRNIKKIHQLFENDTVSGGLPDGSFAKIPIGSGIGVLYIPRFGRDYAEAIVQGNKVPDDNQLEQGTAHYGTTALPGQKGNFAIAGHRVGKGEPFLNLDQLKAGDAVVVETKQYWYVYRVLGKGIGLSVRNAQHIPGREIIDPDGLSSNGYSVLAPVPDNPSDTPASGFYLTMTTCHPKFTAEHRMIIHAQLAARIAPVTRDGKRVEALPAQVKALYAEVGS